MCLIHVCLYLEYKPGKIAAVRRYLSFSRLSYARSRSHIKEVVEECGYSKVGKSSTKKHRSKITLSYELKVEFIPSSIYKLHVISQLAEIVRMQQSFKLRTKYALFTKLYNFFFPIKMNFIFQDIIYTLKLKPTPNRPGNRRSIHAKNRLQLFYELQRIFCLPVKLVYECEYRYSS